MTISRSASIRMEIEGALGMILSKSRATEIEEILERHFEEVRQDAFSENNYHRAMNPD